MFLLCSVYHMLLRCLVYHTPLYLYCLAHVPAYHMFLLSPTVFTSFSVFCLPLILLCPYCVLFATCTLHTQCSELTMCFWCVLCTRCSWSVCVLQNINAWRMVLPATNPLRVLQWWGECIYITYNNKYKLDACDLNVFGEKIDRKNLQCRQSLKRKQMHLCCFLPLLLTRRFTVYSTFANFLDLLFSFIPTFLRYLRWNS